MERLVIAEFKKLLKNPPKIITVGEVRLAEIEGRKPCLAPESAILSTITSLSIFK